MKYFDIAIVGVLLLVGIFSNSFSVENHSTYQGIYYDNVKYSNNVTFYGTDGLELNYNAELHELGDYYEIYFDVVNDSSADIKISNYHYNDYDKYVDFKLSYADNKNISKGDIIPRGESRRLKYKVYYKNLIVEDNYKFDGSFNISYEQIL